MKFVSGRFSIICAIIRGTIENQVMWMKRKFLLLLIVIVLSGCFVNHEEKSKEENRYPLYLEAYRKINRGDYDEAIEILMGMKDYLDGEDLYYEAIYRRLLQEVDHYFMTQEKLDELQNDYLILSYDNRNQAMQDQQGLYFELLIIATKIQLGQTIDCESDFYYYQPESFWDNFESVTVLNAEQLKAVVREYRESHEKDCVFEWKKEEE